MELSELKELVRSKVTTQADIAKEIGVSYSTLSKWMAKNEKPILEHLQNLPKEYREEAIQLFHEWPLNNNQSQKVDSQSEALAIGIPWFDPKWRKLYNELKEQGL